MDQVKKINEYRDIVIDMGCAFLTCHIKDVIKNDTSSSLV